MAITSSPVSDGNDSFIYRAPVVGHAIREVRDFYDHMAPVEDDSAGVAFGKNVIRYGTVAAAGVAAVGVASIVCL